MILLPENPTLEVITSEDIADAILGETTKISKRNGIAIVESSTKPREKGRLRRWLGKKARAYDERRRTEGLTPEEVYAVQDAAGRYYRVKRKGNILLLQKFTPSEKTIDTIVDRLHDPQVKRAIVAAGSIALFPCIAYAQNTSAQPAQGNNTEEVIRYEEPIRGFTILEDPLVKAGCVISASYPRSYPRLSDPNQTFSYKIILERLVTPMPGKSVNAEALRVHFTQGRLALAVPERINLNLDEADIYFMRSGELVKARKSIGHDAIRALIQRGVDGVLDKNPAVAFVTGLVERIALPPEPQHPAFNDEAHYDIGTFVWDGIQIGDCQDRIEIIIPATCELGTDYNRDVLYACLRYKPSFNDPTRTIIKNRLQNPNKPYQVEFSIPPVRVITATEIEELAWEPEPTLQPPPPPVEQPPPPPPVQQPPPPVQQPPTPVQPPPRVEQPTDFANQKLIDTARGLWRILRNSQEYAPLAPLDNDEYETALRRGMGDYRRTALQPRKEVLRMLEDYFSPFGYSSVSQEDHLFGYLEGSVVNVGGSSLDIGANTLSELLDVSYPLCPLHITRIGTPQILAQGTSNEIYEKVKILKRDRWGENLAPARANEIIEGVATRTRDVLNGLERTLRDSGSRGSIQQYAIVEVSIGVEGNLGNRLTGRAHVSQELEYVHIFFQFHDRWHLLMVNDQPNLYSLFKSRVLSR